MYALPSAAIAVILFALIVACNEAGVRAGQYFQARTDDDIKVQTTAIQAGLIGLLALILAFSFNLALGRYDARAKAEMTEANAIGTAMLRTQLLPRPYAARAGSLFDAYVVLRLAVNQTDLTQSSVRRRLNAETGDLQARLWEVGVAASDLDPRPVTTGYFLQALNDVIDAQGARNDELRRHVPPEVFYLLFLIFGFTSALIGYASGIGRQQSRFPGLILSALVCLLVFLILDLDRPRRGLIEVRQDSMEALRGEGG